MTEHHYLIMLKSDRFGMEIMALGIRKIEGWGVKIRPFRYGNNTPISIINYN